MSNTEYIELFTFFFFLKKIINLFLLALGLHCCGPLFVVVQGCPIAAVSFIAGLGL